MNFETLKIGTSSLAFYSDAPNWEDLPCAAVGQLMFSSIEEGCSLIELAVLQATEIGAEAILGPMNGDTWHSYRVVSWTDERAPFPLEPISGPNDFEVMRKAGFETVSQYASTSGLLNEAIGPDPINVDRVNIMAWDGQNGDALVDQIYAMSADSFAQNVFFKPLDLNGFREIYRPLIKNLDPKFVLFATHETGKVCGFAFGYPADDTTIVLKTYASGIRGVGHALADAFHRTAQRANFTHVIHGLMHSENRSLVHSAKHGLTVFRRYDLLALTL